MVVRCFSLLATFAWLMGGVSSVADEDVSPRPTLTKLLNQHRNPDERSGAPPNEAAKYFVQLHDRPDCKQVVLSHDGRREKRVRTRLLVMSWFQGNGGMALQYEVHVSGRIYSVRNVYNWARQSDGSHEISYGQIAELTNLLESLPTSGNPPPIDRTVYVSFQDHADWRTETYDADRLPVALEAVMQIVGERIESLETRITPSPEWPYGGPSLVPVWK